MDTILSLIIILATWSIWRSVNQRLFSDVFSPFNLLFYFWIAPFLLSLAKMSRLQQGLTLQATAIAFACTALLILSSLLPAIIKNEPVRRFVLNQNFFPSRISAKLPLLFFLATLVALFFAEFQGQDLPLVSYLTGVATDSNLHTHGKDSKLQVIAFGIYVASIFIFYIWLNESSPLPRASYLIICISIVFIGLFKASKSDVYIPLIGYAALVHYHWRDRDMAMPKVYKVLALLLATVLVSVTAIRLQGIGLEGGYSGLIELKYVDIMGPAVSEIVAIIYGYSALGFQNFSNYVNSHPVEFRLGTSLLRPVLSVFMMGNVADANAVPVSEWNVVSDAANTGTFLTPLYIEGGFFLCLLGSLLYGLFVNLIYVFSRRRPSLVWRFMYIGVLFPWTWLFFTNAFSVLSIYVNLVYIALLGWLCIKKPRRIEPLWAGRAVSAQQPHRNRLTS
jgi:oligosaccharide repeat unit polymerase